MAAIGVPSVRGLKDAVGDYAVGAGGGLIMQISQQVFGSTFFGSLIAAGLAGSVVKGSRGETLALMAGFQALSGMQTGGAPAAAADTGPAIL